MTKGEIATIRNTIARLKKQNCGCAMSVHAGAELTATVKTLNECGAEVVSRIYLDTWVIPALVRLLPESRNPKVAELLSRE